MFEVLVNSGQMLTAKLMQSVILKHTALVRINFNLQWGEKQADDYSGKK